MLAYELVNIRGNLWLMVGLQACTVIETKQSSQPYVVYRPYGIASSSSSVGGGVVKRLVME